MWVSWGAVPDGEAGHGLGARTGWARLRVQCGDIGRPYRPCPPGWFPYSAQQEVPRNQTGVLASSTAGLSKHRPRSPSWQQWRIVAATAGLPGGRSAWTNREWRPLLAQVCRGFSGTWRPGWSCLCGQSRKWGCPDTLRSGAAPAALLGGAGPTDTTPSSPQPGATPSAPRVRVPETPSTRLKGLAGLAVRGPGPAPTQAWPWAPPPEGPALGQLPGLVPGFRVV